VTIGKIAGDVPDLAALNRLQPSLYVVVGAERAGFLRPLIGRGHAVVAVGPAPVDLPVDVVRREYSRPERTAIRTFLECGLSDIHLVDLVPAGADRNSHLLVRTSGFAEECMSAGLDSAERMHIALTAKEAADTVRRLLWQDRPPQAILTLDDRTGSLVNTFARKIGLRVPEDISVFANFGLSCARVTSLVVPVEDVASAAADAVCHRLADPSQPPRTVLISPRLLDRGTVSAKVVDLLRKAMFGAEAVSGKPTVSATLRPAKHP
jgi:LacI family transcriptional regulator